MNRGNTITVATTEATDAVAALSLSGLYVDRPATPAQVLYYYSTDRDQVEVYVPAAAKWFLFG